METSHETSILRLQIFMFRKTPILKLQSVKIGGGLAGNARFDAPTCLVSSLWFSSGFAVSMGEAAKPLPFRMFPSRLSCRFAWQARRFVTFQTSFDNVSKVVLCGRRNTLVSFSQDELQFFVAGAAFWRSLSSFCVAGAALHTPPFTLHTRHVYIWHTGVHSTLEDTCHTGGLAHW